jgi:hypothetical protein
VAASIRLGRGQSLFINGDEADNIGRFYSLLLDCQTHAQFADCINSLGPSEARLPHPLELSSASKGKFDPGILHLQWQQLDDGDGSLVPVLADIVHEYQKRTFQFTEAHRSLVQRVFTSDAFVNHMDRRFGGHLWTNNEPDRWDAAEYLQSTDAYVPFLYLRDLTAYHPDYAANESSGEFQIILSGLRLLLDSLAMQHGYYAFRETPIPVQ